MPWKEGTKVDERRRMMELWESGLYAKVELAGMFGVSRPTLDLWIGRYEEEGASGLIDRAPMARHCPHRTDEKIVRRIVKAKEAKPRWGPKKLMSWLGKKYPRTEWPAASTAGEILDRHGLVETRRKRRARIVLRRPEQIDPSESGEMMSADHKGQFRLGNGELCYPLTINDPVSRYSYAITALDSTSIAEAQPVFERVFGEYGIPQWMKTDNGGPFCSSLALGGLSRLTVWWIKLGIHPMRIHRGCPWENGAHERGHRTLKAETTRPPAGTRREQQRWFDRFRHEYNHERPHEALGGRAPITALKPCPRPFPSRTPVVEYPGHFEVRSVRSDGRIKFRGGYLFVADALVGERVGLEETDDGIWSVSFSFMELARYDARTGRLF